MNKKELRIITDFIRESNSIERIFREPTTEEITEFINFLDLDRVYLENMVDFVKVYQSNAVLRNLPHLNVQIGNYIAPQGGYLLVIELSDLLDAVGEGTIDSYHAHKRYELLHPFTDGNGRSGRALWAWQQVKKSGYTGLSFKFLQEWYYQSLDEANL